MSEHSQVEVGAPAAAEPRVVAAVDLGSNSFHMIVARRQHGRLQVLDRLREPVRLAAGLDEDGGIGAAAERRALRCLERFGQRLRELGPEAVRALGTNTLRQADNAQAFLNRAEGALGHAIEVISGFEEARLIYLGVAYSLADDGARRLVLDIGGGSTELIIGERSEPQLMESLAMGCVSLTERYFAGGELSAQAWRRAQLAAAMELEPVARGFRDRGWERAVGASGTIQAVQRVVTEAGWSDQGISAAALRRLRDHLLRRRRLDRVELRGLSEERRTVFAGGVVVLLAIFEALGIERLEAAEGALREGVLYDLLGREHQQEVRSASVVSLMRRYHVDNDQAERVRASAAGLLRQVADDWELEEAHVLQALEWAAQLHEIGLDISHNQYHKHGAYVVEHADLAGFSRQEQQLLAVLVRGHRRKFPQGRLKALPARLAEPARRLLVLLRLAVVLHRGRSDTPLPPLSLEARGQRLRLSFPPGWLDGHPLQRADLELEAGYLRAARLELTFA